MRRLEYVWLDVFAEEKFQGNQLAVFPKADELNAGQMQQIAREMNLSETTFVSGLPQENGTAGSTRVRIFTTREELPFAGHPTLGTAYVLREKLKTDTILVRLSVGDVAVAFSDREKGVFGEMTQPGPVFGSVHDTTEVAEMLGVSEQDIDPAVPVRTVSTGNPFMIVTFRNLAAVRKMNPDFSRMAQYLGGSDAKFVYAVCLETENRNAFLHARMPFYGGEDPATGSAAGPAAALMLRQGLLEPEREAIIEQGIEVMRPSALYIRGSVKDRNPYNIRVGGYCRKIGEGFIDI